MRTEHVSSTQVDDRLQALQVRFQSFKMMASYLLYILGIGGIGGGGFALYEQARTGVWEHLPLALGLLLVGLAILGGAVVLTLGVKGTIGKKEEA